MLVSGKHEGGKSVRIVIPLEKSEPFKAKYSISSGITRPDEKLEWKDMEVSNSVIKCDFQLSDCTVIRILKDEAKEPDRIKLPDSSGNRAIQFRKDVLKVTDKLVRPDAIRTIIRYPNGYIGISGKAYSGKVVDTTSGTVDGTKNVIPCDKKSNIVEILFPKDSSDNSGGVTLYFGPGPKNADEFTFWVYPRVGKDIKKATLQFYMTANGVGSHYLSVDLAPDKWQRVIIPCDKIEPPYWGEFTVVGDPKLPEYAKGNKVSFEFNGFCVIGNEHQDKGITGLQKSRLVETDNQIVFCLIGKPDSYFEYRHVFKAPVEFSGIYESNDIKGLNYVYRKDAQVLEISGQFPKGNQAVSDQCRKLLTAEELLLIEKQSLSLLFVKAELKK